jgi:2-polyprenyl-3-methyl-5-hydroxy-6-metoxy-1,4-benzoquinol methylase
MKDKEEVGRIVQNFYNQTPFPDYDLSRFNSKKDLEIQAYPFAKILDRGIPESASVIDVGTGTGQLSSFLSLRRRKVVGIDFSDSSLNKARQLKEKLNLKSLELKKVNLMSSEEIEKLGQFDYVLCMGVLHHTGNAYEGFKNILKLVKPGGYIAVGLYNSFGRIPLKIRILAAKTIFKNNQSIKDYFIKIQIGDVEDKERARGWWNDQYLHPHETTHTLGEVIKWFNKNNIEFYQSIPSGNPFDKGDLEISGIWNKENKPSFLFRILSQLKWIITTQKEGGYWITLGKKLP